MLATLPCDNDALPSPTATASPADVPLVVFPAAAPAQPMGPPAARVRGGRVDAEGMTEGNTQGNTPAKEATVTHDEDEAQGKAPLDDEGGTLQDGTLAYEAQADDTNHTSDAGTLAYDVADTSASDVANGAGGTLPHDTAPVEAAGKAAATRREAPARGKAASKLAKIQAREATQAVEATAATEAVEGTMPYTARRGDGEAGGRSETGDRGDRGDRGDVEVIEARQAIEAMVCRQHYPMFQRQLLPMARQVVGHMQLARQVVRHMQQGRW